MYCPITKKLCYRTSCSSAFKCSRAAFCKTYNLPSSDGRFLSSAFTATPEIESLKDASPCDGCRSPLRKCDLLCSYCARVKNLSKLSYFEVFFGCEPSKDTLDTQTASSFDVDPGRLQKKYYALQQKYHPDHYFRDAPENVISAKESVEASAEISSFLARAYSTLKDPFQRAVYMLTLNGVDFNVEDDSQIQKAVDLEFLSDIFDKKVQLESGENVAQIFDEAKRQLLELQSDFKILFAASMLSHCISVVVRWKYQKSLYDTASEILDSGK